MSYLSSVNRMSGLATGLDTDGMVKQLMQSERLPLNKLTQKKQILQWQRDDYRDITNLLRGFQDEYFNLLKPSSNMSSSSAYKKFSSSVTDGDGKDTTLITAIGGGDAVSGSHSITVKAVATAAKVVSDPVTKLVSGSDVAVTDFSDGNTKFNITLDGVTKTITLSQRDYGTVDELINNNVDGLGILIKNAFGADRITVAENPVNSGILQFSANGSKLTLSSSSVTDGLGKLKITSGATNIISTTDTLDKLQSKLAVPLTFNASGKLNITINDQSFTFDKSDTLSSVMSQINGSSSGVQIKYSELSDTISITAREKGAINQIKMEDVDGNFFAAMGISTAAVRYGTDANFDLDGLNNIFRSDNTFTIEGVSYTLSDKITVPATFSINLNIDSDAIFNNIKTFIDKYNEIIMKIDNKLGEPKYSNFLPLTDEQKEAMSEDQIKKWEDQAKSGLLKNDPLLDRMLLKMRSAIFDGISGVSGNLSQIGINTGTYDKKGQLFIDELKLKEAIKADPDKVKDLFSKKSSIDYTATMTAEKRAQRYKDEGFAQRIFDIMRDNIRTARDSGGKKGILIEKAGILNDTSEYSNLIEKSIYDTDVKIKDMNRILIDREDRYYKRFTALEKAISKMNEQSSWLSQQFSATGQQS